MPILYKRFKIPPKLKGIKMPPEAKNAVITYLFEMGYCRQDLAKQFDYHISTIFRIHDHCIERKSFKRPPKEKKETQSEIYTEVKEYLTESDIDPTIEEVQSHLVTEDIHCSKRTVYKNVKKARYSSKVVSQTSKTHDLDTNKKRVELAKPLLEVLEDPNKVPIFIDEAGFKQSNQRERRVSKIGQPAYSPHQETFHSLNLSLVLFCSIFGINYYSLVQQTLDAETTTKIVDQALNVIEKQIPDGKQGVPILDNASIHSKPKLAAIADNHNMEIMYLPPYTPDLNMAEYCFSYMKSFIRSNYSQLAQTPANADDFQDFLTEQIDTLVDDERTDQKCINIQNHLKRYCQAVIKADGDLRKVRELLTDDQGDDPISDSSNIDSN